MDPHWEHFHHGADIGVRGIAPDKTGAYVQAALALTAVVLDLDDVQALETVAIECRAPDDEILLVDWLNAIIYEMATRKMLFSDYSVELVEGRLKGRAVGEPVDVKRHQPAVEIKGATFTELKVAQDGQGNWIAQCVVDV